MNNLLVKTVCQNCGEFFELSEKQFKIRQIKNRLLCKICDYKDRQQKIKSTCKIKYGCTCALGSPIVRAKAEETCKEKYGTAHPFVFGSKEYDEVIKQKYNVTNVAKLNFVVRKREETLKSRTGHKHALQVEEYWEKAEKTCKERHGKSLQECTLGTVSKNKVVFQGIRFDSLWEVSYYIFCKHHNIDIIRNQGEYFFEYLGHDKRMHKYYPDFYLPSQNKFVEIKSEFFLKNGIILDFTGEPNFEKTKCVKQHAEILNGKDLLNLGVELLTKNEFLSILEKNF